MLDLGDRLRGLQGKLGCKFIQPLSSDTMANKKDTNPPSHHSPSFGVQGLRLSLLLLNRPKSASIWQLILIQLAMPQLKPHTAFEAKSASRGLDELVEKLALLPPQAGRLLQCIWLFVFADALLVLYIDIFGIQTHWCRVQQCIFPCNSTGAAWISIVMLMELL